jgi:uncharacterized protein (TIGR04255 family)
VQIKLLPRRHYAHAPITEAIIAITFESLDEVGLDDMLKIQPELKPDYPKRAEQFEVKFEVNAAEQSGKAAGSERIGYQYLSADQKRIVRITRTDFSFSQLAPYDRWETLQAEAKRLWSIVDRVLRVRRITRVGVRFVNRIDVPCPTGTAVDLETYFNAAPKVPAELPQMMSTYFIRLQIPFDEADGVLILALANAAPPAENVVSTLLDIDAIKQLEMDSALAWQMIGNLRDVKNAAFEASITDATRELCK